MLFLFVETFCNGSVLCPSSDGVNAPSSDIKTRPVLALMQYGGEQYTLFAIAS